MANYIAVDKSVIRNSDTDQYFRRIDSAESLKKMLHDEEAQYQVSSTNVEIDLENLRGDTSSTDGILITFCVDDRGDGISVWFDLIISGVLGTFISDWY